MDEEGDSPQFWLHSTSSGAATGRKSSLKFLYSTLFMMIVAISALLLLFFALSSFSPSISQILKPNTVRMSWDSINVLLVLFAIVCGIFARWKEDADVESNIVEDLEILGVEVLNDILPQQPSSPTSSYELRWYELSYEPQMRTTARSGGGMRRNSSSYPDLRQQSEWESTSGHGFRYYDDFEISRSNQSLGIQSHGIVGKGITRRNEDTYAKEIPVDTYTSQSDSPAKSPSLHSNSPSQPPPPVPPNTKLKKIRVHRSVPKRERSGIENAPQAAPHQKPLEEDTGHSNPIETSLTSPTKPRRRKVRRDVPAKEETQIRSASVSFSNLFPQQPSPPTIPTEDIHMHTTHTPELVSPLYQPLEPEPNTEQAMQTQETEIITETEAAQISSPSPPPPPDQNQKVVKKEKKKNSAKKEIAMVWASIYKRKQKQNQPQQQQLGRSDSGNFNGISQLFSEPEPEPEHISPSQLFPPPSPIPPPPPPPPPHSVFHSLFKKTSITKTKKIHSVPAPPTPPPKRTFITSGKPPKPKRAINYTNNIKSEYSNGSESPLFDIPRPPPLPPFMVPETKYVVKGDYARIKSNSSSRSGSPEPYVLEDDEKLTGNETALYCPSPDVNAKADTFIARLRGEWRLEKMNSKMAQ